MNGYPEHSYTRQARAYIKDVHSPVNWDSEFVLFAAGSYLLMGASIHVRIDSNRHGRHLSHLCCDGAKQAQFRFTLHIELIDASFKGLN